MSASTSTQAMNNVNKVQQSSTANKASADKKSTELQFEALFSSALGQIAPNAQLNSIEAQLRESLFNQDNKKNASNNANAEAAQATVWAQRNWMQNAAAPATPDLESTPAPVTSNNNRANEAKTEAPAQPAEKRAEKPAEKVAEKVAEKQADKPIDRNNKEQASTDESSAAQVAAMAASAPATTTSNATNTVKLESPVGPALKVVLADNTETGTGDTANPGNTGITEEAPLELVASDKKSTSGNDSSRLQDKSGVNAKVDAVLSNSTVSVRADTAATNAPATFSNASAIAAQLAPQIAQQAQNQGEALELEGLKPGQKIAAGAILQSNAALIAGTNGLGNATGTAQQALIKTPVTQPGFAKELGQTVQWAIGKNLSTVDIRINPESFGPMNMRLVQKGQQVQLVIRTQDEASATLLTQALSNLKEVMAQNGLQLNQVQIQHGNTPMSNGQANNGQPQFDQGNGHNRSGQQSAQGDTAQQDSNLPASTITSKKPEGTLDLFA